jgi:thymidylate synthase
MSADYLLKVDDIRKLFVDKLTNGEFVTDKSGVKTIEVVGATFLADEDSIFGVVNDDYVKREIEWYQSMSLNVNDIPNGPPKIWKQVSSSSGEINSNYGWCIWSKENGSQYENVVNELVKNIGSRRSVMIYTRPSMWSDYNRDGMSDFICTNAVGYLVRDGRLTAHVQMRSCDVVFGYKNDLQWAKHVHGKLAADIGVEVGDIIWTATSLHVYEKFFNLVKLSLSE